MPVTPYGWQASQNRRQPQRPNIIEPTDTQRAGSDVNETFGQAFDEYSARGLRFANSMLRSLADAEEVVQEAFCRLLVSRHKAEVSDSFAAVFFTTVRNLSVDVIRRRKKGTDVSIAESIAELRASPSEPSSAEALGRLKRAIESAMDDLPQSWADALRLRVDGRLSYSAIAEVLKCTKPQVRTWIFRARRQIEQELLDQDLIAEQRVGAEQGRQS